jgi:hypothetical protein
MSAGTSVCNRSRTSVLEHTITLMGGRVIWNR